jgi:hypothetical protein
MSDVSASIGEFRIGVSPIGGYSGPPYPHPRLTPGSNAIGRFVIGVSPIGDIPPFDFWVMVLSQYANSPTLYGIIQAFNAAMDMTENLDNFYDLIWNILTAQGYGLDVWGRIVNVSRTVPLTVTGSFFGFQESGANVGFGQGPFYGGSGQLTNNFVLADPDYRRLIMAKAATNVTDMAIPSINKILLGLFPGRGRCYVTDGENMTMTYTFEFALTPVEVAIVNSGVLPRPCGVAATVVVT